MRSALVRWRTVWVITALALFAAVLSGGYCVYDVIKPEELKVINQTDEPVTVMIGTWYRLDVEPQSSGILETGWFPFTHDTFQLYSVAGDVSCRWDDVPDGVLVVDAEGANCEDITPEDYPRDPFSIPSPQPTGQP